MIKITEKKNCCGCGACMQACPRSCITMVEDSEGFAYPQVDENRCVQCGLCRRVCPMEQEHRAGTAEAWAAWAKEDALRQMSSSGGVFSLIARQILNRGGVVFGAAFTEEFSVRHESAENEEQLARLRGSKYAQSSTETTFRQVKEALEAGRPVLYSGVACQIAGLRAFLGKDDPQLWTVDVLCHGVPSPKLWRQYLKNMETRFGSRVCAVSFRCKDTGWKGYSMRLAFENGAVYSKPHGQDPFFHFFLEDICLRPSCHSCRFKDLPRVSDITLGDAWGISGYLPDMDDDKGTSVILVNTEKGGALLEEIKGSLILRQGETDRLLPPNADSRRSVPVHPRRREFFAALKQDMDIEALEKFRKKTLLQKGVSFGKRTLRRILKRR